MAFDKERDVVCKRLQERRYPPWTLKRAVNKIAQVSRQSLLQDRVQTTHSNVSSTSTVFSTPYSLQFKQIVGIIQKHLPILHADAGFSEVLQGGYKCVSRRALTLGNILSPSLVSSRTESRPTWLRHKGCFQCAHSRCICCRYVKKSSSFTSAVTDVTYPIKQFINCATTYVVYLFTCDICNVQYTGSTMCALKTRVRRHISDVNASYATNISAVSRHIREIHDGDPSCLTVQAIERLNRSARGGDDIHRLRNREAYWMFVLKTCNPHGLNRRTDLILHY